MTAILGIDISKQTVPCIKASQSVFQILDGFCVAFPVNQAASQPAPCLYAEVTGVYGETSGNVSA